MMAAAARGRFPRAAAAIALVFTLGVGVLLYPDAASWFTQYSQSQRIDQLTDEVRTLDLDDRKSRLEAARAYSAALTGGASVAANANLPAANGGDAASADYESLLRVDSTGLMARVRVPAIDLDLPVYHGTSDAVLRRGVGHLRGTALPVGGDSTHAVLTAHRGLADAQLFTRLDEVAVGDTITIEVFGEVLVYKVRTTQVVAPDETETLYAHSGRDLITLVTCTPLGLNTHRILVTAERVLPVPPEEVDAAGSSPDIPGFAWWAVAFGATVAGSALYVGLSWRATRRSGPAVPPNGGG